MLQRLRRMREGIRDINARYVKDCLNINILSALYGGVWPTEPGETNPYLRLARFIPFGIVAGEILQFFLMINDFLHKTHNTELAAESVMISIVLIQAIVRTYVIIFKMDGVIFMIRCLERCSRDLAAEGEKLIFARYKMAAHVFTIVYQIFFSGLAALYAIQPMFETERRMPGNMIYPFDTSSSPMYEIGYTAAFLGGCSTSTVNGVFDAFCVSIIVYIIAQFKILHYRLEHLKETAWENVLKRREAMSKELDIARGLDVKHLRRDDWRGPHRERGVSRSGKRRNCEGFSAEWCRKKKKEEEENERQRNYRDKKELDEEMDVLMAKCVQFHNTLLGLVKHLENHLAIVFTCELTVAGTLTCVALFLTAMYPSDKAQLLLRLSLLVIATGELFAFCWSASELSLQSANVNEAMYFCDWLEASPSFKKSLQIVIARSLQPVEILAAPTLPFSMELYRRVLDSGYSFYTLVIQFHPV